MIPAGIIHQKNNFYTARIVGNCGEFSAQELIAIAQIASTYGNVDVLPIAKARGFWDTDEPCYQKTVLRVLSTMDNALPIFIYYLREKKILSPSFFIFIAAFKSLS